VPVHTIHTLSVAEHVAHPSAWRRKTHARIVH
jgi:hypothetical protein